MFDHIVPAPSDSDIPKGYTDALDDAVAELAHYVDPTNVRPVLVVDTQARVEAYATAHNVSLGMALTKWQEGLKRLCTDEATRLDRARISLDIDGHFTGRLWSCPPVDGDPVPQVIFAGLRTTSPLFKAHEVEAVAVYYLPPRRTVVKYNRTTGLPYEVSDDYDARGYLGIVRTFDSVGRAEDACSDLENAVRFIGRPAPTTYVDEMSDGEVVRDENFVGASTRVTQSAPVDII